MMRRHAKARYRTPERSRSRVLRVSGWVFLGVVLLLAVVAILFLLKPERAAATEEDDSLSFSPGQLYRPAANDTSSGETVDNTGNSVHIRSLKADFTPPEELSFGIRQSIDFSSLAPTVCERVRAAGWGKVSYRTSDDGSLVFYAEEVPVLGGNEQEQQSAFLATDQPEALARTFLQDSGLVALLSESGLSLDLTGENKNGSFCFYGDDPEDCSLRFSFFYTGAFNQLRVRAFGMTDSVTTDAVVPLSAALARAFSWSASASEETDALSVEIRSIRGIPFYVFTCEDGSAAYALAVDESVLSEKEEVYSVYQEILHSGIQEYIELPGAGY